MFTKHIRDTDRTQNKELKHKLKTQFTQSTTEQRMSNEFIRITYTIRG